MKLTMTAGGPSVELAEGTYAMTIIEAKEDRIPKPQFGDGTVVRFFLELDDMVMPDGEPVVLDAIASAYLTPGSKLTKWIKALGFQVEIDQEFDFDTIKGARGLAVVENVKKDDGSVWPRVKELVGAPTSKAPAALSLRKPDGKPDYNVFWTKVKELGKSKADVDALNVSIPGQSVDFLEAVLAKLKGGKEHEHDFAYTEDGTQMVCRGCGEVMAGK